MEKNKTPNRASQTSKSDSTKVETQAKSVKLQKNNLKFGLHHRT